MLRSFLRRSLLVLGFVSAFTATSAFAADLLFPMSVAVGTSNPPTVTDPVIFNGTAAIKSRVSFDPDQGQNVLILVVDLSSVTGVGLTSFKQYVVATRVEVVLPHAANQQAEFVFPFSETMSDPLSMARTGTAKLVFNVDPVLGTVGSLVVTLSTR